MSKENRPAEQRSGMSPLFLPLVGFMSGIGAILGTIAFGVWIDDVITTVGLLGGAALGAAIGVVIGVFLR